MTLLHVVHTGLGRIVDRSGINSHSSYSHVLYPYEEYKRTVVTACIPQYSQYYNLASTLLLSQVNQPPGKLSVPLRCTPCLFNRLWAPKPPNVCAAYRWQLP